MRLETAVEFYRADTKRLVVRVESDAVPRHGELVNISQVTYRVASVSWAVDQITGLPPQMIAAVWLEPKEQPE